jgi:hypothetical protein
MRWCSVLALVVCAIAAANAADGKKSVQIVSQGTATQLKFGLKAIEESLERRGFTSSNQSAPFKITLGIDEASGKTPESYEISGSGRQFRITGSDPTGAMYGAFEVAEQIEAGSDSSNPLAGVRPVAKSPYLEVRGENIFLTTQDINDPESSFWSDKYWQVFLDMLARDRYNLLDIHGPCDAVSLDFPNAFAYFVSVDGFPEVGVGAEQASKNLARLRWVIRQAADRGIKVAYMNYEAAAPIGPWRSRKFGVDERWTPMPQEFLSGPRLEQYTRQAVSIFLRELPDLWMFGFRIGESGQPEDFYKKTYLAALADAPPHLRIYIRTWVANPKKVRELAESAGHPVYIEPKYNGEQLGLPYQAAQGGREYPPSGSYEDYTNYPRKYLILWQIRAHGTHRVFHWAWPEFARRTVRSCKFGDGVGFSMESMNAYLPAFDFLHHNDKIDHRFYRWAVEREWAWHLIWGRTAYDPDVSDEVFVRAFSGRFGAAAGESVFKALVESSKIVPFVYAYHNIGLDHQDFAPEFETGDHAFGARVRLWQGSRLVPYGGNNDDFLRVNTLDRTAMSAPARFVEDRLQGISSGRMSPFEAAEYLDAAAQDSEAKIRSASNLNPESRQNFDCIRMDIEAVAWLGRYYADRIRSATHLAFYEKTQDHAELTKAHEFLSRATSNWDKLSDVADNHFGYVPEYIRMGVRQFRWRDEGRSLGADLEHINYLEGEFRKLSKSDGYHIVLGHTPPAKAKPGVPLSLHVTYATQTGNPSVCLFYRNQSQLGFTKVALKLEDEFDRRWTGEIPSAVLIPGFVEYYFEAMAEPWGPYGGTLQHRAPYRVLVGDNSAKLAITLSTPDFAAGSDSLKVSLRAEAKSTIARVRAYYKPLPAFYEWRAIDLDAKGKGNYAGALPVTSEGILYYFEAIDSEGNGSSYPNFLEQTPYLTIEGWPAGN